MWTLKKLSIIYSQNPVVNSLIVVVLTTCLGIYISSIHAKLIYDDDVQTDLMKLILVTVNVFGFLLISFGRHKNIYEVFRLKVLLFSIYAILLVGLSLNYVIMVMRFRDPENETPLGFDVDSLTWAMTLLGDIMFLTIYVFFRSRKIMMLTMGLITFEILVFGVSFVLGTDDVIDTVNLSTSMVTLLFSIIFWSGETIMDGPDSRFQHFYEDVDMQMQPLNPTQSLPGLYERIMGRSGQAPHPRDYSLLVDNS
ncbi:hypothetical protein BGZ98_008444 [Dissophora globulifera]|nr:hypothetical protein BGZ98_008444 [Dissophora globulifera]